MRVDIFNTDKKYNIIYADPPWSYKDKALSGNRGACCKYPVMSIEDICNLPVNQIADKDCILFMWVTMPKLNECFKVMEAWGFEYKTSAFTWVKKNKKSEGKPKRVSASVHSVIISSIEEHSKKPNEARERIVQLCGDIPRIELFARQYADGWDCWGNEV